MDYAYADAKEGQLHRGAGGSQSCSRIGSRGGSRGWTSKTTSTHLEDGLPLHESLTLSPYMKKLRGHTSPYTGKASSHATSRASTSGGMRKLDVTRLPSVQRSGSSEMLQEQLSQREVRIEAISQLQAELVADRLHRKKLQTAEEGKRCQVVMPQWPQWSQKTSMPACFLPPVSSKSALQWRPQRQNRGRRLRGGSQQPCSNPRTSPEELLRWVDNLLFETKGRPLPKGSLPSSRASSQPASRSTSRPCSSSHTIAFTPCDSLSPLPTLDAYDWLIGSDDEPTPRDDLQGFDMDVRELDEQIALGVKEDMIVEVPAGSDGKKHVVPQMDLECLDHLRSASEVMGMSTDRDEAARFMSGREGGGASTADFEYSYREPQATLRSRVNTDGTSPTQQATSASVEVVEDSPMELEEVRRRVVEALADAARSGMLLWELDKAEANAWRPSLQHTPSVASWYSSRSVPLLPPEQAAAVSANRTGGAISPVLKTPKGERVPPGQSVVMSESVLADSEYDALAETSVELPPTDGSERGSSEERRVGQSASNQQSHVSFTRDSLTEEPSQELPTVVEEDYETDESAHGEGVTSRREGGSSVTSQMCDISVPWQRNVEGLGQQAALLYISQDDAKAAFHALEQDGRIQDIEKALHFLGHRFLEGDLVENVLKNTGVSRSGVELAGFLSFVEAYQAARRELMENVFREVDQDNSGRINEREISRLLRNTGITPLPGVVPALLLEVTGQKRRASCDMEEFVKLFSIVSHRAGFTASETQQLKEVFERFDIHQDGLLETAEFQRLLSYMGFVTAAEVAEDLIQQVVSGHTPGKMDFAEFLLIMRKHREYEVTKYQEIFSSQDADMNGTISAEELEGAFEKMGYICATFEVIQDCRRATGLHHVEELLFEDFIRLLEEFRKTEGFTREQLNHLEGVYNKFSLGREGGFNVLDFRDALRHLGLRLTHLQLQTLVAELDFIRIRELSLTHWVKLVGRYREIDHQKVREAFLAQSTSVRQKVERELVRKVMVKLGVARGNLEDFLQRHVDMVAQGDLNACLELYMRFQFEERDFMNTHDGFIQAEVHDLDRRFKKLETYHHGAAKAQYVSNLLQDYFPPSRGREAHLKAREAALEMESGGATSPINFKHFLKIVHKIQDEAEVDSFKKHRAVVKASGWSASDVEGFREIFESFSKDLDSRLASSHIKDAVRAIVPQLGPGGEDVHRLRDILKELDWDNSCTMDFPEFLELMWRLQEMGFKLRIVGEEAIKVRRETSSWVG
mmetsp:Transcript_34555/g.78959  ORF Transcript_34555/g.78959 Transcript_34555/m.78959 type:complete len:1263 (+) Transcript_34555:46-3834(+)